MNKRGWIRILEATVAVLIVSGTMLAVYSQQPSIRGETLAESTNELQNYILDGVVYNTTLRLAALGVHQDITGDINYDKLTEYVDTKVPDSYGYLLRVCELGNTSDYCKMDTETFIATMDRDVFSEEVVISAELGDGSGEEVYSPKRVRLFFWEGKLPEPTVSVAGTCQDLCSYGYEYECNGNEVWYKICGDSNGDGCLDYVGDSQLWEVCGDGRHCYNGVCGGGGVASVASVSLSFVNMTYSWDGTYHWYNHDRVFHETGGVGVTFTSGQVCTMVDGCDVPGTVDYRVDANGYASFSGKYFRTVFSNEFFNVTYFGIDDNGNSISVVSPNLEVSGSGWTIL